MSCDRYNFGEYLRRSRSALGLSMGDVARKLGVKVSHVSAVERGRESPTPYEAWVSLCEDVLGVSSSMFEQAYGGADDKSGATTVQPNPRPIDAVPVWHLVINDMRLRNQFGIEKYGTPLQANNGRDALVDAYQEALDLCVYLRQAIEERGRGSQ